MTNNNCPHKEVLEVTVPDIKCGQCKKKFLTQNLFEWHGCFLKTRSNCLKCGAFFAKKKALLKHYIYCDGEFITPESARDHTKKSIKPEITTSKKGIHVKKSAAGVKKKTCPPRRMTTMVKAERELNVEMTQPDDDELDDYENITYDNYGSDDDYSHSTGLEPEVDLQESNPLETPNEPRIIEIKAEKSFEEDTSVVNVPLTVDHIRKVKREQIAKQQAIKLIPHKNPFAVKVKKEAENGDRSAVKVNQVFKNPFSNSHDSAANKKKVFKIPQKLAMKIKKEKNQSSSVVVQNESQIDEADADPEEEEQMQKMATTVVKEEKEARKSMVFKQVINPLAVAKRDSTNSNESNSLIISAVSSISEEHHLPQEETPAPTMMTVIPAEFNKTIHHDEETRQHPSDQIEEDFNNLLSTSIVENNQIEDIAVNNSNNDELDELLEKYGSSDIQDDDIQDLLKFA